MKKRTLALIMALVLMLSVAIPGTLAVSLDGSESTTSTFSADSFTPVDSPVGMKISFTDSARLYTTPYSGTYITYGTIDNAPTEYKVLRTETHNGELWYVLDTSIYGGTAPYEYLVCIYVRAKDAGIKDVKVELDGVGEDDKITVTGTKKDSTVTISVASGDCSVQWQIYVPSLKLWANILPGSSDSLSINYGMLASIMQMNGSNEAQLRARCTDTNGIVYYSDPVTVTYDEATATPAPEATETPDANTDSNTTTNTDTTANTGDDATTADAQSLEAEPAQETRPVLSSRARVLRAPAEADIAPLALEPEQPVTEQPEEADAPAAVSDTEAEPTEPTPTPEATEAPTEENTPAADTYAANEDMPAVQDENDGVMPADNSDGDVKKTYNIVINYKFENNEIVSDPYTANLAEGSSFSATVTFPTVQGYLPYVNDMQQNSIELNYASVSENVTINVVYKPTNVNYTVIHYQQNVENDNYTEVARETKQGLTASTVPEVAKTYEGFYNLLYERPAIAADGSTVIEVYYDRYYYLMNFDMDGGYGTDPVYARYGAEIKDVQNPTKAGYTFKGWSETKDGTTAVELPKTMPAESKTYYALWEPDATAKVTVVFWGENADDEKYSYLSDYTKEMNLRPGSEFTYSEGEMLTCGKNTHTHNDDCYELTCTQDAHEHNGDCYTCESAEHKHSVGCYPGASSEIPDGASAPWNAPSNPKNGQVLTETHILVTRKYIYINGNWYTYSGNKNSGSVVSLDCGMTEHTHTTDCIGCGKTEHEHTRANCYTMTCKEEEHKHTSSCYEQGAGLDSTLWKFVKSDTITVAADGSSVVNVYYDRVEYSVQFYENQNCSSNREYTSLKITAKWGQNILNKWPTYNGSSSWYVKDRSNTWQNSIQVMPVGGAKFWGPKSGNSKHTATYYVEILDGESYDVKGSDGRYYKVHHTDTSNSSGNVTDEERYGIDGFTINNSISTSNGSSYGGSKFYYTRNSYKLTFNDQYDDVKNETVKFEAPLSTYKDYVPEVPSAYEPGSVEFGGWYQNPQCTGEEYKLDEHTMPSNDIILYAKWVPVNHTVKFYLTEKSESIYMPEKAETEASFTVPHGDNIAEEYVKNHLEKSAMNEAKPNGDYTFVMWYYYENGEKKPFDPTTQIRKDLTLYGEWSSNTLKEYTVQYVLKSDHSVKVADDLTGSGLAGTTKTFDAKGGAELYAAYQEGYFPTVQSQSLLLDIDAETLTITFEYVPMPAVPYTVKYVEKDTGKSLADDKVVSDNRKAVVTETFKPITGYMPDAYQKRLVVTADGENILYFYYSKDETHAYYKITHYTQNTDGTTWSEYASSQAIGDIGTRYTASPMTIPGFTYKEIKYVVNGTEVTDVTTEGAELTENGLEINLYYVRNEYPYVVRYLEQGSGKVLVDPKNGTGKFGQVISESAIDIDGYDKVDPTSATLNIRIDEGEGAPNLNIITFYYKETEVTINYVAVGPTGATDFGNVTPTTETVKVTSGTAQGSTPTAGDGFKFVGWYKDAACTQKVEGENWLDEDKIVPQKTDGKNVAATYYAKFEWDKTTLTIKKVLDNSVYDKNDSFIFTVKGEGLPTEGLKVVIQGTGSKTISGLKVGETYTVTEDTGWSWRYTPTYKVGETTTNSITLTATASENVVKVTNSQSNNNWLDGSTAAVNEWKDGELKRTDSNANH